jgi:hypothetical protein
MALVASTSGDGDVQVHGIPGMSNSINERGWRDFGGEAELSDTVGPLQPFILYLS